MTLTPLKDLKEPQKRTKSAGGVVLNPNGQILLVQEYGHYWGLPRGHVEPSESLLETAAREITEESGITSFEYLADLGSYERSTFDEQGNDTYREIKHMTFFLFSTTQTALRPQDKNITDARWVDPEEVVSYFIHLKDKDFYRRILPLVRQQISGIA